jgi:predicted TIM-barrel fold metal-dependent hydrolase
VKGIEQNDRRMKHVYFDACGIAIPGMWEDRAALIVERIRQIGIHRILYGSDAAVPGNLPREALERWRRLPLTQEEFRAIESNIAPYVSDWLKSSRAN